MARPYVPLWMSGTDALNHIMQATGCKEACALRQLQHACRDGAVDGRQRGSNALRDLARGDGEWRVFYIYQDVQPNMLREFLTLFGINCEFRREAVLSTWPPSGDGCEADADKAPRGAPDDVAAPSVGVLVPTKRRHNGLDYRLADAPLVAEMRSLIEGEKARSPEDAARSVCGRAEGHGKPESKVKRLTLHYHQIYRAQS